MMIRQVHISELFRVSRAAVSISCRRKNFDLLKTLRVYLIRYLFRPSIDKRLSRKHWLKRIERRKVELIGRALEIERRRSELKNFTKAKGFSRFIESLIDEIVEEFKNACYRLKRRWKILSYRECRSLLYKRFHIRINEWSFEYFRHFSYRRL